MNSKLRVSFFSVIIGLVVGLIIAALAGFSVVDALLTFIRGFTGYNFFNGTFNSYQVGEVFSVLTILVLAGLSVAFAFRTGLFNIGAEGQIIAGQLAAVTVALSSNLPAILTIILATLSGIVAGALIGIVPGALKAFFNVSEVVVCIMMNYIVLQISNYVIPLLPNSTSTGSGIVSEEYMLKNAFFSSITNNSSLNNGIFLMILAVILFYIIIDKTTYGYSLKVIGYNKSAAEYAGMKVNHGIVSSMAISGMFAGLAGVIITLGIQGYTVVASGFAGYGFDGIAVALVGLNNPFGIIFSGLLFAGLGSSRQLMELVNIPSEIAIIISAVVLYLVAIKLDFSFFKKRGDKK